jgi:hypothetical protein
MRSPANASSSSTLKLPLSSVSALEFVSHRARQGRAPADFGVSMRARTNAGRAHRALPVRCVLFAHRLKCKTHFTLPKARCKALDCPLYTATASGYVFESPFSFRGSLETSRPVRNSLGHARMLAALRFVKCSPSRRRHSESWSPLGVVGSDARRPPVPAVEAYRLRILIGRYTETRTFA